MKLKFSLLSFALLNGVRGNQAQLRGKVETAGRRLDTPNHQCPADNFKCGLWGDPHIETCDGLKYDCQAAGIITLMENNMINMQGITTPVSQKGWEYLNNNDLNFFAASITTSVAIEYLFEGGGGVPTVQFGFGEIKEDYANAIPSEAGCATTTWWGKKYSRPAHYEPNVHQCRQRCILNEKCTHFTFRKDGYCLEYDENAPKFKKEGKKVSGKWSKYVSGSIEGEYSDCGKIENAEVPLKDNNHEDMMVGRIGTGQSINCPLLVWENNVMVDASSIDAVTKGNTKREDALIELTGTILTENDNYEVFIEGHNTIIIKYASGLEIKLVQGGRGPGSGFGCNWHISLCLPDTVQDTVGILGNANGILTDEFVLPDSVEIVDSSNQLDLSIPRAQRQEEALDWCKNWCVETADESILSYHGGLDFDDLKCQYTPPPTTAPRDDRPEEPERTCEISEDIAIEWCQHWSTPKDKEDCLMDCCLFGCEREEPDVIKLGDDDDDDRRFDPPPNESCEAPVDFHLTGDEVCPDKDNIVELMATHGAEPIPDGATVFYGLETNVEPNNEHQGTTVRFKVNNPFPNTANLFIKYATHLDGDFGDQAVAAAAFTKPVCKEFEEVDSGCINEVEFIYAACIEHEGHMPYALIELFYEAEEFADGGNSVDKCCPGGAAATGNVASYTFKIDCLCPSEFEDDQPEATRED